MLIVFSWVSSFIAKLGYTQKEKLKKVQLIRIITRKKSWYQ